MIKDLVRSAYKSLPAKAPIFRCLKNLPLPEKLYRHLHFEGEFSVELLNGRKFRMFHFGNQVENDLFWVGYGRGWERTSLVLWEVLARKAPTIFDVGANTGTFALAAKAANPAAHVEAFEPVARVFEKLSFNVQLNGHLINAHCLALSDHDGTATLYDNGESHVYSASLNAAMLGEAGHRAETTISVKTLDTFCRERSLTEIALLKIDTEMHEPEVLAGAKSILANDRPAILIEILNASFGREVQDLLRDYSFFRIDEGVGLTAVSTPGASGERNYLALHNADKRLETIGTGIAEEDLARVL